MTATDSAYGQTWYAATAVETRARDALVYDLDVDACIIGGGLAGLNAAYLLARRGWSVALLEAERVAWNASGRNGGFVGPGFAQNTARIIERVGRDCARELWALSEAGVAQVRETIRETGMPGIAPADGWLYVQRSDDADKLRERSRGSHFVGSAASALDRRLRRLKTPQQGLHLQTTSAFNYMPAAAQPNQTTCCISRRWLQ